MRNKIITALFCFLIILGVVSGIVVKDKYYSESEKRKLAQFPQISISKFISGEMADDIEKYLADQFPARDSWITIKTLSELISGKRDDGGVYFAGGGYLIEKFNGYDAEQYKKNIAALKAFSDNVKKEYGVGVRVVLVPTAVEILSDKLPSFAPHASQAAMLDYAKSAGLDIVDVTEALKKHSDEYIYYKTDHHFTSLGAYYCYAAWKAAKGETADPLSAWKSEILCDNFRGTTYAKVNYPFAPYDTITAYYKTLTHRVDYNSGSYVTDSIYERKYLEGKDQYAAFLNSNQSTTVISGSGQGKLLILKDSYANTFSQFVIDEYEETHLIDMRFYTRPISEYIKANGITEVMVMYNIPNFAGDTGITFVR